MNQKDFSPLNAIPEETLMTYDRMQELIPESDMFLIGLGTEKFTERKAREILALVGDPYSTRGIERKMYSPSAFDSEKLEEQVVGSLIEGLTLQKSSSTKNDLRAKTDPRAEEVGFEDMGYDNFPSNLRLTKQPPSIEDFNLE